MTTKIINLENFGTFEILGKGTLEPKSNDGRYEFHPCSLEEARGDNYVSDNDAELDGWVHCEFIIRDTESPEGYGFFFGETIIEALETYFRILSEDGLGIEEIGD